MTASEYIQLKAFARVDGARLAVVWIASFGLYLSGLTNPLMMVVGMFLAVGSPFFAAYRLSYFRDKVRDGIISYGRAYAYSALTFFYAALLLALAQFIYFQYLDNGHLVEQIDTVLNNVETQTLLAQSGAQQAIDEALTAFRTLRPIDLAINYLSTNIVMGLIMAFPIAACTKKSIVNKNNQ